MSEEIKKDVAEADLLSDDQLESVSGGVGMGSPTRFNDGNVSEGPTRFNDGNVSEGPTRFNDDQ
jgi:hypothetical protein